MYVYIYIYTYVCIYIYTRDTSSNILEDALYYAVFFDILPQHLVAFAQGLTEEAAAVELLEPKTARFHLWQSTTDASRWVVLEAFREAAGDF